MKHSTLIRFGIAGMLLAAVGLRSTTVKSDTVYFAGSPPSIAQLPLYLKDAVPPLNMLVMGKDQKTYFEAYNDASDLNGDGALDVGYKPNTIEYYGYFNSYACYEWQTDKFVPVSKTADKRCSGRWSGDFLNYVTTSRMDALRRVLYGGWRQVDTDTQTVLQGAYFPQDGHSWGKEYQSIARDGYDIRQYTPLGLPADGRYHLFAITTLTGNNATFPNYQAPVFRVLRDSPYRIWNWLSIEGPVAGNKCFTSGNSRVDCTSGGTAQPHPGHPANRAEFDTMVANYATPAYQFGSGSIAQINCTTSDCNPFGVDDNYLTIIDGTFHIGNGNGNQGYYQFSVDGDDAVDLQVKNGATIVGQAGYYDGHDVCNCNVYATAATYVDRGDDLTFRFRHEEAGGGDQYILRYRFATTQLGLAFATWQVAPGGNGGGQTGIRDATITTYNLSPTNGAATRDADRFVRVLSCPDDPDLQESICHAYPNGHFKPTGILHDYGETKRMFFGLITGSQSNNIEGGVLRRNISSFADEINAGSGTFKSGVGIADTISRFRMIGGGYNGNVTNNTNSDTNWNWANGTGNCPSQGGSPLTNGQCRMWGNPIAEMMYESMRYFAGAAAPTARFSSGGASEGATEENTMGLGTETWKDPYAAAPTGGGYPSCAKPYQTVISDINPSFDGDLPNSAFAGAITSTSATPASISGFSASAEGDAIWQSEFGGPRTVFIGEVGGVSDGAPTAKVASSFGNIRGLSPEEPSKNGTYYAASVARFARNADLNTAAGDQNLSTYSIALASPLPRIEVPLGNGKITLNPFAKTVSGTFGGEARKPTNTIVDFYVQELNNFPGQPINTSINGGLPKAIFRINYEDVEQGNDFDMDAIARYEITAKSNGTVDVQVISEYAAGSANQYMGYTLSGTNGKDGVYLEICDLKDGTGNSGNSSDKDLCSSTTSYTLNTPPGRSPGYCSGSSPPADCAGLPPTSGVRNFSPGTGSGAIQLQNPLWYAAKYGAPEADKVDADGDGTPDNYFLVTNPLNLRKQLSKAFDNIIERNLDVGVATVSGARVGNNSFTLQPSFRRARNNKDWTGNLTAVAVTANGTLGDPLWNAQAKLPAPSARMIRTIVTMGDGTSNPGTGIKAVDFLASNLGANNNARYAALGISPGNVTTLYGGAYSPDDFVAYLRGDTSRQAGTSPGGTLRERSATLGDIVNSEPIVVSPRNNYGYLYYTGSQFAGYDAYLTSKAGRKTVAYVGANDGMLHAFDASTLPCGTDPKSTCAAPGAGTELFAFIPNGALNQLGNLPLQDAYFNHRYNVDGGVVAGDAKGASGWKTLVVGSMGGGGRSVFAIDASTPDTFSTSQVLWERNSSIDLDIGNVYGKPLLVPLENGAWGVLFGNGYGGNLSDPSLYILDAFTGAVIKKITANDGNVAATPGVLPPILGQLINGLICSVTELVGGKCASATAPFNGLGQITAIDRDGDGKVDTIYGGDLQGNLWKFDLSAATAADWKVANGGLALFNAATGTEKQPITGGIRVAAGPGTGVLVYFGTGRYFVTGDNDVFATPQVQSLYAYYDNFNETSPTSVKTRANLVQQTISAQVLDGDFTSRTISANQVFYFGGTAKRGWYIDLKVNSEAKGNGERFIATPLVQSGRIFFTTYTPSANSCDPGGTNFQYALDLLSGAGALTNVAVLPGGTVACKGANCGAVAIGGKNANAQPPVVGTGLAAINPVQQVDTKCDPKTQSCASFEQCQVVIYPGAFVLPRPCGRQSWRQLK